jgi:hypothetical protein
VNNDARWTWRANEKTFKHLSLLARSVLPVLCSSAAAERLFPAANNICSVNRTRLSSAMLEAATMVRSAVLNGVDLRAEVSSMRAAVSAVPAVSTAPAGKKPQAAAAAAAAEATYSSPDGDG